MGIQVVKSPIGGAANEMPGPLPIPAGFDRKKWAAKWVKVGPDVQSAAEREWIVGSKATADGWEVWRDPKTKKPQKVALSKGTFVLLCRDLTVQKAVNAIYGNIGKERLLQERAGETVAGVVPDDPGMLNDEDLSKVLGREEEEDGAVVYNPVPDTDGGHVHPPVIKTVGARRARR